MSSYDYKMKAFCDACLEVWGPTEQVDMMLEEMNELGVAIAHYKRGRCEMVDVLEEIADVELMCKQMRSVLESKDSNIDVVEVIDKITEEKIERTKDLIKTTNPEVYAEHYYQNGICR